MKRVRRMCPSCWSHNKAWVLFAKCPFCGGIGRPIPDVVGPGWPDGLREMVVITETDLCRSYRVRDAQERVPTLGDLGVASAPVRVANCEGTAAEAVHEAAP